MKICENCDSKFNPRVSYQVYCSDSCREVVTKQKIVERYKISRRQKRIGKKRKCLGGCNTQLSIYNDSGFCTNCNVNEKTVKKMIKELRGYIEYEQDN